MDIYFTEDLDRLERALLHLLRLNGPLSNTPEGIRSTFDRARAESGGGWSRLSSLDLSRIPDLRPTLVTELQAWLFHVCPSAIAILIEGTPSDVAIGRFNELSTYPARRERAITAFDHRIGIRKMWELSQPQVRAREFHEFFLSINAEMTYMLRRLVGCGLAVRGPIPQIEMIAVDRPLMHIPSLDDAGPEAMRLRAFMELMGRSSINEHYENSWSQCYPVDRRRNRGWQWYQVLYSTPDWEDLEKSHGPAVALQDLCLSIVPFLALGGFYDDMWRSVLEARNALAPILYRESVRYRPVESLGSTQRRMAHTRYLSFREKRLWGELTRPYRELLLRERDLTRSGPETASDSIPFGKDALDHVDYLHTLCDAQLSVLGPSFGDLLQYKTLRADRRLQITVAVLAVISLVVALLGLLTEDMKRAWWSLLGLNVGG